MKSLALEIVPGLIGGVVGGFVGYLAFAWIVRQGFYAPVLPGALAGIGCGLASRSDSNLRGALCAVVALLAGLLAEWWLFPLPVRTDGGFLAFLRHAHRLPPITLIMLGLGGFLGFWWGREWTLRPRSKPRPDAEV